MHGDAAFIGQGIVAETLNLSQLHGYSTGGTIHIVVNNQIGFTTLPKDARSSQYATDVAKMIEAPIFHVNGDDPLAVKFVSDLAFDFRQQFGRDVVIDLYCYRRYGHNEGDEPSFTQPDLYAKIEKRPSVTQLYKRELLEAGTLSEDDAASLETEFALRLEMTRDEVKAIEKRKANEKTKFRESTAIFQPEYTSESEPTAINEKTLGTIVDGLTRTPEGFEIQPKIKRIVLEHQRKIFEDGGPYEWHYAEALAFGSLLLEGIPVRLSGQDSSRGTFSTRHSVLYDAKTGEPYVPLMHLADRQARICIYNSPLSEAAVLGFDYGYSLDYPKMLCLWEAQFGDFANGAQTIIDQFIVSAESKWQRPSGIVLLLPHGYEGQGAEHSSARLERFLQACAEDNIQVCNLTTAASVFSCVATPDEARLHQTAHHYDAEEPVARKVCVVARGRIHPWPVRRNSRLARSRTRRQSKTDHLLRRQSLLRSAELQDPAQDRRRGDHSHRAALSARGKKAARNAQAISEECEVRLVPGRTGEHGRMDFYGTSVAHDFLHGNRLRWPRSQCQPRRRRARSPQTRASPIGCRCIFTLKSAERDELPVDFSVRDFKPGYAGRRAAIRPGHTARIKKQDIPASFVSRHVRVTVQ